MCSVRTTKMMSFWVIFIAAFAVNVGTSQPQNGCRTHNQTYSSIAVTWTGAKSSLRYQVKLWPLYSKKKNVITTVTSKNTYVARDLEPSTLYAINVTDMNRNKIVCAKTTRTGAERFERGGLNTTYINSTTLYAEWKDVKIAGKYVRYHAFIEWSKSGQQYAHIVYNGTRNYTWVIKPEWDIPKDFTFHVNVIYYRRKHRELQDPGSHPQVPATWNLKVSVVLHGTNYILISWNPLPSHYGNMTYSVRLESRGKISQIITTEKQQAEIRKLHENTAYKLQVQAHDVNGNVISRSIWKVFYTKGNITRKCKGNTLAEWVEPDDSGCVSKDITSIHDKLQRKDSDPVSNAKKLSQVIKAKHYKFAEDIKLIVHSLDILASKETVEQVKQARGYKGTQANELAMSILNISSTILDDKVLPIWDRMQTSSTASLANKVIQSIDGAAVLLTTGRGSQEVNVKTENIAISVKSIPNDKDGMDQLLASSHDKRDGYGSSVYFPGSVLKSQGTAEDGKRYLSVVTYKTINQVLPTQSATTGLTGRVQAPVVSVTLQPLTRNKFDKPVVLTIARPKENGNGSPTCAFLNVTNSSLISWSSEGCEVGSYNETHTQCLCYHLTSFAILMQVVKNDDMAIEPEHRFALSVISYSGLCTSILALLLVFFTFTLIRFLNLPRHLIHANLALSLALAQLMFLFGIDRTESKIVCKVMAISLHYMFLVAFSWMALEGVVLYLMLVKVFRSSISTNKTKIIFIACGWGIPAVIVGISSAVFFDGYGTKTFCWLSLDRQFIWAFVGPVLVTITFNFVWLGFTFHVMAKNSSRSSPKKKAEKLKYWVRSCFLLTCILGVTWLLGVFYVNKQTLFMAYLFSICNGFQGLAIFLLHCVGDRKIRAVYLNLLHCHTGAYGISRTSGDAKRDSSTDQKSSPKKRLMKQGTRSSLLSPPAALQQVEQVKQSMENRQSVNTNHKRIERPRSDNDEFQEGSPLKSSTPLLKPRFILPDPKSV